MNLLVYPLHLQVQDSMVRRQE